MSLNGALLIASGGLANISRQMAVVSNNVANAGTPDYAKVNVQFSSGSAPDVVLGYKKTAAGCDASGGWYYDVDPAGGATPTKIELCPKSCEGVKGGTVAAKLNILLGCQTIVK